MARNLDNEFESTANFWSLNDRQLQFDRLPALMGIVNVTPDSFSDGGRFADPEAAVQHALGMVAGGASILDVGGESTRPYSEPVETAEEIRRVIPVIREIRKQTDTAISIDTSKADVARAAINSGANIINDVTGFRDPAMIEVAADSGAGVCVMHMQGTPQTMQDDPQYDDVVEDVFQYLAVRRDALIESGITREKICLDPGVGFGKTHAHNLQLVAGCERFHALGCPVLVGHSRKGFIGKIIGDKTADRDPATLAITLALAARAIHVIRVHEITQTSRALLAFDACGGIDGTVNG